MNNNNLNEEEEEESTDIVGDVLAALDHLAVMSDDLYAVLGEDPLAILPDDMNTILSSYESISDVYNNLDTVMPSKSYDASEIDGITMESTVTENTVWKALVKKLGGMGLKQTDVSNADFPPGDGISLLFGIPMRAGKWADTWFAISTDKENPYIIKKSGSIKKFGHLGTAVANIEAMATGIKESLIWDTIETFADDDDVNTLRRIRNQGYIGMAEDVKIESIISKTDEVLTQAIIEFRDIINTPTSELQPIIEAFDESKFKKLVQSGLVDESQVTKIIRALKLLDAGKELSPTQKNLITSTFLSLIGIITGDTSVLNRIQSNVDKKSIES